MARRPRAGCKVSSFALYASFHQLEPEMVCALIFIQSHLNEFQLIFKARDQQVIQGIQTARGALDLICQAGEAQLALCQPEDRFHLIFKGSRSLINSDRRSDN